MIEGHGDDTFRYGTKIRHNFSTNICSGVDHTGLMAHLASLAGKISSYPEPSPRSVEKLLADEAGIDGDGCVMVTNGATEAIYLIAQMLRDRKSAIVGPTFREYQDACAIHGHSISHVTSLSAIPRDADAVWLCNPDNPTGKVSDKTELLALTDRHRNTIFIIDQAYSNYTALPLLTPAEVIGKENVVTLHSLTKRFAIPACA